MNFVKNTLRVSTLALAAMAITSLAQAADPAYNPATAISIEGTITAIHEAPAGQPLTGLHVTIKTKAATSEIFLAPKEFLKFLHMNFAVGDVIDAMGSKVKTATGEIILAREVSDGMSTVELRDLYGAEAWKNWGVAADPASLRE